MGRGIPAAVLNSGEKIPLIGMGTASATPLPGDLPISPFITAMEMGYRHFDTAALYGSEAPLGQAIAQALQQGVIKSRDELFITSKLWCTDAHHDRVLPALKNTLEKLELEYIDLYLIHWPMSMKPGEIKINFSKEDILPMDFKAVWDAMEECHRLGLVKSIGVSNFSCKKLSQLMANAKIPPAVNQVEMNPAWQQRKLRDFCKENGIHVSAWSPLGANGAPWGSLLVMENPVLKEIADAKGKSLAQVGCKLGVWVAAGMDLLQMATAQHVALLSPSNAIYQGQAYLHKVSLRWIYQQGVSVLVKSYNKERMKANLEIFDWELSEEELQKISQIPQRRGCSGEVYISPDGPFKSLEDLWDEAP